MAQLANLQRFQDPAIIKQGPVEGTGEVDEITSDISEAFSRIGISASSPSVGRKGSPFETRKVSKGSCRNVSESVGHVSKKLRHDSSEIQPSRPARSHSAPKDKRSSRHSGSSSKFHSTHQYSAPLVAPPPLPRRARPGTANNRRDGKFYYEKHENTEGKMFKPRKSWAYENNPPRGWNSKVYGKQNIDYHSSHSFDDGQPYGVAHGQRFQHVSQPYATRPFEPIAEMHPYSTRSYDIASPPQMLVAEKDVDGRTPIQFPVGEYRRFSPGQLPIGQGGKRFTYPVLYVDPIGLISITMRCGVVVEMTLDKTIRLLVPDKFAATANVRGTVSSLMHPLARISQEDTRVLAQFGEEKLAVVGAQGILFAMKGQQFAYLINSTREPRGTIPIAMSTVQFPSIQSDFTMNLFYASVHKNEQGNGGQNMFADISTINEIVRQAKFLVNDESIYVAINGIAIKQHRSGDVDVHSAPRHFQLSPKKSTISLRTHYIDMGVQDNERAYIKRGVKRMHVSKSGMVVSDGQLTTSMDFAGRIVSSC